MRYIIILVGISLLTYSLPEKKIRIRFYDHGRLVLTEYSTSGFGFKTHFINMYENKVITSDSITFDIHSDTKYSPNQAWK